LDKTIPIKDEQSVSRIRLEAETRLKDKDLWEVTFKKRKARRTEAQNNWYWATLREELLKLNGMVLEISEHSGHTPLEIRDIVAAEVNNYLGPRYGQFLYCTDEYHAHCIMKTLLLEPGKQSSSEINVEQFSEFAEHMIRIMSEILGVMNEFR